MVLIFDPLRPIWISSHAPKGKKKLCGLFLIPSPAGHPASAALLGRRDAGDASPPSPWSQRQLGVLGIWVGINKFKTAVDEGESAAGPGRSYLHSGWEVWIQRGNNPPGRTF